MTDTLNYYISKYLKRTFKISTNFGSQLTMVLFPKEHVRASSSKESVKMMEWGCLYRLLGGSGKAQMTWLTV